MPYLRLVPLGTHCASLHLDLWPARCRFKPALVREIRDVVNGAAQRGAKISRRPSAAYAGVQDVEISRGPIDEVLAIAEWLLSLVRDPKNVVNPAALYR
ncbi:MAG: hypothetical protein KatS3mg081_0555 [Gemmatimonadales bacterium]|nr:MAG: hypothetical protein KatS3mg081_0555 [Gemmatimonadales bacterium]